MTHAVTYDSRPHSSLNPHIQNIVSFMSAVLMNFRSKLTTRVDPESGPPGASTPRYCRIHDIDAGQREGSLGVRNGNAKLRRCSPFQDLGSWSRGGIMLCANAAAQAGDVRFAAA